jgi:DNA-directed RNA polymerase subunit RPC12/RpoP
MKCERDFVYRPRSSPPNLVLAWCPWCGSRCQSCGKKLTDPSAWANKGCPGCESRYLDADAEKGAGYFEWLSFNWWKDGYTNHGGHGSIRVRLTGGRPLGLSGLSASLPLR